MSLGKRGKYRVKMVVRSDTLSRDEAIARHEEEEKEFVQFAPNKIAAKRYAISRMAVKGFVVSRFKNVTQVN